MKRGYLAFAVVLLVYSSAMADVQFVEKVTGFETGDLVEFSATAGLEDDGTDGSCTAASNPEGGGSRGFRINDTGETAELLVAWSPGSTYSSGDFIIGFAFRTDDATPASAHTILAVEDTADIAMIYLELQTDGTVDLKDEQNVVQISSTDTISDNNFHYIEMRWRFSSTGYSELFLDSYSQGTDASGDFVSGNNIEHVQFTGVSGRTLDYDDLYIYQMTVGTSTAADRCSDSTIPAICNVVWFSGGPSSATPDSGNDLDAGQWVNISDMPVNTANSADYTGGALGGHVNTDDVGVGSCTGGPSGCSELDDDIIQSANWLFIAKRGTGSPTAHKFRYGNSVDTVATLSRTLSTSAALWGHGTNLASSVPTKSEYCVVGMEKDGGAQDINLHEAWCYILVQEREATGIPPTAPAGRGRRLVID